MSLRFLLVSISLSSLLLGLVSIWAEDLEQLPHVKGPDLKRSELLYRILKPEPPISAEHSPESSLGSYPSPSSSFSLPKGSFLKGFLEAFPHQIENKNSPSSHNKRNKTEASAPEIPSRLTGRFHPNMPQYYQGLYLTARTANTPARYEALLRQAHSKKMNVLVVDVQPRFPNRRFFQSAKARNFYLVSRIVVFEGGLKRYPPSSAHLKKIYSLVQKSAEEGFDEIQLDYIRFSDTRRFKGLSLQKRYQCIENILKEVEQRLEPYGLPWGVDLFGRVAFNQNDRIGQKMELFAVYVDTIYPMLYPSHFYGMPRRIRSPYSTVKDGIQNSIKKVRKVKKNTRIIAYIQAFKMSIAPSGLSFVDYMYKQLRASAQAGGSGYIAWNARNRYASFFKALDKFDKLHRFEKPVRLDTVAKENKYGKPKGWGRLQARGRREKTKGAGRLKLTNRRIQ